MTSALWCRLPLRPTYEHSGQVAQEIHRPTAMGCRCRTADEQHDSDKPLPAAGDVRPQGGEQSLVRTSGGAGFGSDAARHLMPAVLSGCSGATMGTNHSSSADLAPVSCTCTCTFLSRLPSSRDCSTAAAAVLQCLRQQTMRFAAFLAPQWERDSQWGAADLQRCLPWLLCGSPLDAGSLERRLDRTCTSGSSGLRATSSGVSGRDRHGCQVLQQPIHLMCCKLRQKALARAGRPAAGGLCQAAPCGLQLGARSHLAGTPRRQCDGPSGTSALPLPRV
jgi:hypothetical protein